MVRAFFQNLLKQGGVAKEDFHLQKPKFPIPITIPCAPFTGYKLNLRYTQMEERYLVRDASFIAAIWCLL